MDRDKENEMTTYKVQDKVYVNGDNEGRVIKVHTGEMAGMVDVRIWQGFRHVGDVTVDTQDCRPRS